MAPFVTMVAEAEAESPVQSRGPAPEYRPEIHPGDVQEGNPLWNELRELRQKAWDRGITPEELREYEYGACQAQVPSQIDALNRWLESH